VENRLHLGWSESEHRFRTEIRAFLAAELPDDIRHASRLLTSVYAPTEVSLAWQRILFVKGWVAPAWPSAYGGCGWSARQRYLFATELAEADAPPLSPMGLGMLGPVILADGSEAQKKRFLPRILSGEDLWCQGYSEPNSGSDLASLRMQGRDAGDSLICSGQKIWTTHAQFANWIFCLVRTASDGAAQNGITFLLVDMRSPGVEVRPISSLTGEQVQNEVLFQEVAVPKDNVVGVIGGGWAVAKKLMEFERGGRASAPYLRRRIFRLRRHASNDVFLSRKLTEATVRVDCLEALELRTMARVERGGGFGIDASMLKIISTELSQHVTEIALEIAGEQAAAYQPSAVCAGGPTNLGTPQADEEFVGAAWTWPIASRYFNDRAASIYGGTNEIQRNIIAKALLS
jgi:alkylation response protein AidB-like acyl-CoA dehydrogenase